MIELIPLEEDDVGFLAMVQRIVNGAVAALDVREVFLVHVDNWFDFKWLGFCHSRKEELCVPTFERNRIRSERRLAWDADRRSWESIKLSRPLHRPPREPGQRNPPLLNDQPQPIDRISRSAAFIWYSGKSLTDRAGSLMFYLSGAEGYSWYASFNKNERWKVHGERQITRRQLLAFEESGREVVPA